MSQCTKAIRVRGVSFYCQREAGHKGNHEAPPVTWGDLKTIGGRERDDAFMRSLLKPGARRRSGGRTRT